jgi:hypothetical protein
LILIVSGNPNCTISGLKEWWIFAKSIREEQISIPLSAA